MSSFKDRDWEARFAQMGDEAEGHFEKYAEEVLGQKWLRFGLDRPPLHMASLPTRLRYTPDYLMSKRFVEVQGFGRDQTAKFKLEKINTAHWWNDLHPLYFYIWDSHKEREHLFHLFELDRLINEGRTELGFFHEQKAYFAFRAEDIFSLEGLR